MDGLNELKIGFIFDKIKVSDKLDAEEYFRHKALKLGWSCEKNQGERGIPDFKIWKNGAEFYVEVKTNGDGLRIEQARWIKNHPHKKVIIYYLEQLTDSDDKVYNRKVRRRKERELSRVSDDIRELITKNLI